MVRKSRSSKKPEKLILERATATEMIAAYGITDAELRRARAAVAIAGRSMRRGSGSSKKRVAGKVVRSRKTAAEK